MNKDWDFPHDEPGPRPEEKEEKAQEKADRQWQQIEARTFAQIAAAPHVSKVALVGDWLHTGAWLYVGPSKIGKSFLALQIVAAIAAGDKFLEWQCKKSEVLLIAAEDDDERIQQRLAQLGIANGAAFPPPDGCYVFNREDLGKLATKYNPSDKEEGHLTLDGWLMLWLQKHPKVRLIIIDTETVASLIWKGDVENHFGKKATEVDYRLTAGWDKFARERGLVILLVGHISKTYGRQIENPFELQNATNTKVAGSAGQIVLWNPIPTRTDERDKQRVLSIEGRDVPEGEIHRGIHRDETARWVDDGPWYIVKQTHQQNQILLALFEQSEIPGADAMAWIGAAALAEYTGLSRGNVKRTLSRLLIKGNIVTVKGKQYRLASKAGKAGGYRLETMGT